VKLTARARQGALAWELESLKSLSAYLRKNEGELVSVEVVRPKDKRSLEQNAYWHGPILSLVGDCWEEARGVRYPKDAIHSALVGECFGYTDTPMGPVRRSSASLTVEEFSHLIDWTREELWQRYRVHAPEPGWEDA
jgi:hypothetical protein